MAWWGAVALAMVVVFTTGYVLGALLGRAAAEEKIRDRVERARDVARQN